MKLDKPDSVQDVEVDAGEVVTVRADHCERIADVGDIDPLVYSLWPGTDAVDGYGLESVEDRARYGERRADRD